MKKIGCIIICLTFGLTGYAQFSFSAHAGWLYGELNPNFINTSIQGLESMTVGAQIRYQPTKNFAILLDVNYQRQGRRFDERGTYQFLVDDVFSRGDGILVLDYLRLPIHFLATATDDRTIFDVGFGLGPGIRLGGYADMALRQGLWDERHWSILLGPLDPDQFHFRKVSLATTTFMSLAFKTNALGAFGLKSAFHADWLRKEEIRLNKVVHLAIEISLIYYLPSKIVNKS